MRGKLFPWKNLNFGERGEDFYAPGKLPPGKNMNFGERGEDLLLSSGKNLSLGERDKVFFLK